MKITRRQMLAAGGGTLLVASAGRVGLDYLDRQISQDDLTWSFTLPLRIPPTLNPVCNDAETDFYSMTQKEADIEILPREAHPHLGL